jgi:hypothetical protein
MMLAAVRHLKVRREALRVDVYIELTREYDYRSSERDRRFFNSCQLAYV